MKVNFDTFLKNLFHMIFQQIFFHTGDKWFSDERGNKMLHFFSNVRKGNCNDKVLVTNTWFRGEG